VKFLEFFRRRSSSRRVGVVRPGARPLFDASTPLSDAERAEYRGQSRIFGMLEDHVDVPDEGPDQPEAGVAVGEQRGANIE